MKFLKMFILIISFSFFISCCGDNSISSGNDVEFPDKNVSYYEHVHPYMKLTCAYVGCHSSTTIAGGLIMETHINLMQIPLFVMPGDSANSYLMQKLDGRSPFKAYCYQGYVEESVKKGIGTWINEGAKAN